MEEQAPPPLPWTASLNERSENPSGIAPIKPPPHVPWLQQVRDNYRSALPALILLCGILVSLILFNEGRMAGDGRRMGKHRWSVYDGNGDWKRSDDLNTDRSKRDARNARGWAWLDFSLGLAVGPLLMGIARIVELLDGSNEKAKP